MNGADLRRGILEAAWWPNRTGEIRVLIEYGADINERDDAENTALIRSALRGHLENLETLLEYGAALDAGDDFGCTAILKAAKADTHLLFNSLLRRKPTSGLQIPTDIQRYMHRRKTVTSKPLNILLNSVWN